MPIPTPETTPAPRRLLRDVVFDKLLAAIGDGTLELGERLNDDELVSWLGVSRTPVREAIAKLSDFGLVDIEANRYTRVVQPTMTEVDDTLNAALGVWSLAARRAAVVLPHRRGAVTAPTRLPGVRHQEPPARQQEEGREQRGKNVASLCSVMHERSFICSS